MSLLLPRLISTSLIHDSYLLCHYMVKRSGSSFPQVSIQIQLSYLKMERDQTLAIKGPITKTYLRKHRPTASERKRRIEERDGVTVNAPSPETEHVEVNDMVDNEEETNVDLDEQDQPSNECDNENEVLHEPFPGGPTDTHVLQSFKTHVAAKIWFGKEREVLRCFCHTSKMLEWGIDNERHQQFRHLIRHSQIHSLRTISYRSPNRNLIAAFVERWHPETNTFHMSFGEMTITLEDVYCLVGLPVTGVAVQQLNTNESLRDMMSRLLGVTLEEVDEGLHGARGGTVKLEWLRRKFMSKMDSDDEVTLLHTVRAYLLYVLGCTIFADKTGTRISARYLSFFEDISIVQSYAWGAAALAFLYRQLGLASRVGVKQIAGYLTLLEAWIYEHFPRIGPMHNTDYIAGESLARRWSQQTRVKGSIESVKSYRELLDSLRAHDVIWDPYIDVRSSFPRPEVTFFHGCIRSMSTVEPYHPDRVLRQYGHVQTIPSNPLAPELVRRGHTTAQYKVIWGIVGRLFESWDNHLLTLVRRGRIANPAWECAPDYLEWYYKISHPIVQNPELRSNFVGGSVEPHSFVPREILQTIHVLLTPVVRRWREEHNNVVPAVDFMPTVEEAYALLEGLMLEDTMTQTQASRGQSSNAT